VRELIPSSLQAGSSLAPCSLASLISFTAFMRSELLISLPFGPPRIAFAFFLSTSKAAVSAIAFSLWHSSFFSYLVFCFSLFKVSLSFLGSSNLTLLAF